ncbi:MAG: DUF4214 domain-containing protein [Methylococcales bacterium]
MKHKVAYTTRNFQDFDVILTGTQWYSPSDQPLRLNYSFMGAESEFISDSRYGYDKNGDLDEPFRSGYQGFNEHQKALTRSIFSSLEKFVNIEFVETVDSTESEIRLGVTTINNEFVSAYAFIPFGTTGYSENSANSPIDAQHVSGDIWLSNGWANRNSITDDGLISTLTHEIGHALGLDHPFDLGAWSSPFETGTILNDTARDYIRNTMMSYNTWPSNIPDQDLVYWANALTPMEMDIAALQYLYGPSQDSKDDVYVLLEPHQFDRVNQLNEYAARKGADYHEYPSGYVSIADNGGYNELHITFNADLTLDLRPGTWSDTGGGYSTSNYSDRNLYLHESSRIRALFTDKGDDVITGNDFGNHIKTGVGNDTVFSGSGNDTIILGSGDDIAYFSAGTKFISGGDGSDIINFNDQKSSGFQFSYDSDGYLTAKNIATGDRLVTTKIESLLFSDRTLASNNIHDQIRASAGSLILEGDTSLYQSKIQTADGDTMAGSDSQLYRAYYGGMGRAPDKPGYDWWLDKLNNNIYSWDELASRFINSTEFLGLADSDSNHIISNPELLTHIYSNVFGRQPDEIGYSWWLDQLESENYDQAEAFNGMMQSDEFVLLTAASVSDLVFIP